MWLIDRGKLFSTIGIVGVRNKSGIYEDGVRKQRCDNTLIAEELERCIGLKSHALLNVSNVANLMHKKNK